VILHEMAHMWFGDLVTMKWWDDLWLNESFAEWACYHAAVENTSYTESWTGFTNARKNWALRQDQLPSTHPIAADNYDLRAVEVNFDGITYAKGASVLKQLVAWVGIDEFLSGLRQYFKDHAYANAEFVDLLTALEKASGRELDAWAKEWLQTSGVNTLSPAFELTADGTYASFGVRQTTAGDNQTLRRHRLGIGLYDEQDGHLVRRRNVEVDIDGELTSIDELVGEQQPDLLLLNDGDLTYAKIRLDERSLDTVVNGLRTLDDSLARALCWGAAWDMTRDAEMTATDYVTLVMRNVGGETDAFGIRAIPMYATMAINLYSDPARRSELRATWEAGLRDLLHQAEPGSNAQLIFTRLYAGAVVSDEGKAEVAGLLDGSVSVEGLDIDTDLRWVLLVGLAKAGAVGEDRIAEELERDRTISGQENAAAARASRPDADAKAAAWTELVANPDVPNETHRSIAQTFMRFGQEELLAPYLEKYLEAADTAWEELGTHMASNLLEDAFPLPLGSPELVARVDRWLDESPATAAAKRFVREGRADVVRALAAQARDAQG
jgi:aminopeptidase N